MRIGLILCGVLLLVLSLWGTSSGAAGADPTDVTPSPKALAGTVHTVLIDQCVRCHGPTKQKVGLRVDSRAALLAGGSTGPALIPGDPEHSLLMQAVRYDDPDLQMPPDGRLADAQISALAQWIAIGAPWLAADGSVEPIPPAGSSGASGSSGTAGSMGAHETPPPHRAPLIGRFHPLTVHLPIACLAIALLAEFLRIVRGPAWEPTVRLLVTCGMLGAIGAVITGTWFAPEGTLFHHHEPLLTQHEFLGWLTLLLSASAWTLLQFDQHRPRVRLVFRLLLVASVIAISITGHLGGTLVWGPHWLF